MREEKWLQIDALNINGFEVNPRVIRPIIKFIRVS